MLFATPYGGGVGGAGGAVPYATLFGGGAGGDVLCAVPYAGGAGGDAVCAASYAGGCGVGHCLREVLGVRDVLDVLDGLDGLDVMRRVRLCMLELWRLATGISKWRHEGPEARCRCSGVET